MKPLEQMLSPMVTNRDNLFVKALNQTNISLLEKIKQEKFALIEQRISPSQVEVARPEIVESWLRSCQYGLDLYKYNYGPILGQPEFKELLAEKELLLQAADPYIHQLETMLSNDQCIILLSDEQGVMLRVIEGSKEMLAEQNRRFLLTPGSIWTEETVGTCAHGLSLILGTPMQICGPEHYGETYEQISCSAAPIFDANNNLAGTLSIVTPSFYHQTSHSLGLVVSMAWAVQNEFNLELNNDLLSATLDAADEAVITINIKGIITKANWLARQILNHPHRNLVGMPLDSVLGDQPLIRSVLETGIPTLDHEIEIKKWNQKLHLRSAQPVKDRAGKNLGCVLTLKKTNFSKNAPKKLRDNNAKFSFDDIVGSSPLFKESLNKARRFARVDANILIQGESGTGKEVYAQAIHNEGRPDGPFIAINCAAIPKTLIESELFGYEGGAFTGAERQGRPGKIELADGGTLFLDEIGDMPLDLQPVLLRVLEEKKVMRVGGSRYIPVEFRLISATNQDLLELVNQNLFRKDLYYRLEAFQILLPPLRDRGEDILMLAQYFTGAIADRQQIPVPVLSDAAMLCLLQYTWPGNIRQLQNAMLYAVNTTQDGVIKPEDLPSAIYQTNSAGYSANDAHLNNNLSIKDIEKISIMHALNQTDNNISEAAALLKMSRSTLYRKIRDYDIH